MDNENFNEIKILIIDILSSPSATFDNENSETFFTSLGFVEKAEKMAINLANKSFSHFLFTIGNVLPNYMNSAYAICDSIDTNLFTYIAINQYLSDKVYEIIINTSISKHSIGSYG